MILAPGSLWLRVRGLPGVVSLKPPSMRARRRSVRPGIRDNRDYTRVKRGPAPRNARSSKSATRPNPVLVPGQHPDDETILGTSNMLCSDRYSGIGQGATYQSALGSILPLGRNACVDERAGLLVLVMVVVVMLVLFVEVAFVNLSADLARP